MLLQLGQAKLHSLQPIVALRNKLFCLFIHLSLIVHSYPTVSLNMLL